MREDRLVEELAEALWARIRDVLRAAHRLDRLPENEGRVARVRGEEAERLSEEFVLRLLRVGADPTNHVLLSRLAEHTSLPLTRLAGEVGLPALAVAERVADLVQVGLAARSLVGDQVQITSAGVAWVELVRALCGSVSKRVAEGAARILERPRL